MPDLAVIAVPDLMFHPRIEAALRAAGYDTVSVDTAVEAREALARRPAAVVVDLHATTLDPGVVIRAARAIGAGILAFGRHTEPDALRAARRDGADMAVARSQLVEELPDLIARLDKRPMEESESRL